MPPKIVQVCGTNGSGKTTVIRRFLARAVSSTPVYEERRKRPVGYDLTFPSVEGRVRVIGPYDPDLPTGGCDAYGGTAEGLFDLVYKLWSEGYSVLFEGIRIMHHTRGIELENKTHAMNVVLLSTPIEECLASVDARRAASGTKREIRSLADIKSNGVRARNYCLKIYDVGGKKYICDRNDAPDEILNILQS